MSANHPVIRPATDAAALDAVRQLCWEYRAHLCASSPLDARITETFYPVPRYAALMQDLPQIHARPKGIILLATLDGKPAGCAMTHSLDAQTSEIKRLYISPHARCHGMARNLITALMEQARSDGFTRILLDTSLTLAPARALYAAMGFTERGPYQDVPEEVLPHLVFFEAPL